MPSEVEFGDFDVVFDPDYYVAQVREGLNGFTPKEHYCFIGWRFHFNPSPLFDVAWYIEQYPDVTIGQFDPLSDYLLAGWEVRRHPAPWFDNEWYLLQLAERELPRQNPLLHYVTSGIKEGFTVNAVHFEQLAQHRRAKTLDVQTDRSDPVDGDPVDGDPAASDPSGSGRAASDPADRGDGGELVTLGTERVAIETLGALGDVLVSVDVWDTLISRERPADAAKLATALRLARALGKPGSAWDLYRDRVELEAETANATESGEYDARDIIARIVEANGADPDLAVRLFDAEVEDEQQSTIRREPVASIIAERLQRGEPTIVLSDFYIGADGLSKVLDANGLPVPAEQLLVSIDIDASKRLGTAFDHVRQRADASNGHVHIGDNAWSDGEQAERHGATPALIDVQSDWPSPGALTPEWYESVPGLLLAEAERLTIPLSSAHHSPLPERRAISAAAPIAVLGIALVARALDAAIERGLDAVHYLSREGAFLARLHAAIGEHLVGPDAPQPVHVQASRRATFGPSLSGLDADNLQLISRQYPRQSVKALLASIGVDPALLADQFTSLPYDADEVVEVESDAALHEFLIRPAVQEIVNSVLDEQRDLLTRYLEFRGLGAGGVVVDVGWRGSIQDNLARLLNAPLHGVYLGLFPYLNPQSPLATKEAVGFDGNRGERFEFLDPPAIIESPMTPPLPSCISYRRQGDRVEPVLLAEPGRAESQIAALQDTVMAIAPQLARRWRLLGTEPLRTREGIRQLMADIYSVPPGGLADIWFDSGHDDTFGAANVTPYAKPVPTPRLLEESGSTLESAEAISTRWPRGFASWLPIVAIDAIREMRAETTVQP